MERAAWRPVWNDAGLVFTREDGRGAAAGVQHPPLPGAGQQSGLPAIRLHDLRHTIQPGAGGRGGDKGGLRPAQT